MSGTNFRKQLINLSIDIDDGHGAKIKTPLDSDFIDAIVKLHEAEVAASVDEVLSLIEDLMSGTTAERKEKIEALKRQRAAVKPKGRDKK